MQFTELLGFNQIVAWWSKSFKTLPEYLDLNHFFLPDSVPVHPMKPPASS